MDVDAFHNSPSRVVTWRDCQRQWGFIALERAPRPKNKYAERGTKVHAHAESYQKTGKLDLDDPYANMVTPGIKYMPKPGTAETEQEVTLRFGGVVYHQVMDLHWVDGGESYVTDHKSVSSFQWMKSEEELRKDVQAILYATSAFFMDKTDVANLRWIYYLAQEKKPRAKKQDLRLTRSEAEPVFEGIHDDSLKMAKQKELYQLGKLTVKDLDYNVDACARYGGCPFRNKCNLSAREIARSHYMQASMAEKMKARMQKQNGAAAPKDDAPKDDAPKKQTMAEKIAARKASAPKVNPPPKESNDPPSDNEPPPEPNEPPEEENGPTEAAAPKPPLTEAGKRIKSEQDQRDGIAAAAMQALITRREHHLSDPNTADSIAALSYEFADAMLKAR